MGKKYKNILGGNPGLVVMGADLGSKGCGFESQHSLLDGHLSHLYVVIIVMFVWKDEKEAEDGTIFKKNTKTRP